MMRDDDHRETNHDARMEMSKDKQIELNDDRQIEDEQIEMIDGGQLEMSEDDEDVDVVTWHISDEQQAGERIDRFVTALLAERKASRSQVQGWIGAGEIVVNGEGVKPNYIIKIDDTITFTPPVEEELEVEAESIPLDIIYEDEDVVIVNKARGMVVHPALGHQSGTLVNALLYRYPQLSRVNGLTRQGIVHRIDKDTSGLIAIARHDRAHHALAAQLKDRTMLRKYMALVHGELAHQVGTIDAPIGRDPLNRQLFAVTATHSKEAITHFVVQEMFDDYTLVELKLHTGRTHQIRVHMKFIEHPLVGDPLYGRSKGLTMNGQALHASTLGFMHPTTNEFMSFEAPLPADMKALLDQLRE